MLPLIAHRARVSRTLDARDAAEPSSSASSSPAAPRPASSDDARARRATLDASTRPTFFELVAAERLGASLRDALAYALGTLANAGAPALAHAALDRGDEVFAVLSLLAEAKAFASGDGGVAESVYGLQRVPRTLTPERLGADGRYRIDTTQRVMSALLLAFGPYVKSKCAAAHEALAPDYYADARRRHRARRHRAFDGAESRALAMTDDELAIVARERARKPGVSGALTRAFVAAYPTANAMMETATFVAWTGYLLGRWNINDPTLMLVDCYIARALPSELEANVRELEAIRARQIQRAAGMGHPAARVAGVGALRVKNFVMDYAQSALIAAVIGFKLTEWWYGAAEERVVNATTLPVPPPPPRPPPHPEGLALPDDQSLCPLCRKSIRNPAVLTCSGYVFCYSCVHAHVDRYGDCPVSLHRAVRGVDDIRRLFDGN